MRLYRIKVLFLSKDLHHEALLGYDCFEDNQAIFNFMQEKFHLVHEENYIDEDSHIDEIAFILAKDECRDDLGNYSHGFVGEFFCLRYKWEVVDRVTLCKAHKLKAAGVLRIINPRHLKYGGKGYIEPFSEEI